MLEPWVSWPFKHGWSRPVLPPSTTLPGLFGDDPLHPAASIGGGARGGSQILQPRDPPAASRDRPPPDRVSTSASASGSLTHLPHG
ncbi:hypothetical protein SLEP1_g16703 [Rubroshorea leprosula]|uniref:Uncharacterized protein n=1 Tax=Rubroshorea leprosula TaxID=152421 RepID=A0AAV5J3C4_9ROSI|nr:hypothetical protein SLEP1_g16703 [Rubroshorea leprosula]